MQQTSNAEGRRSLSSVSAANDEKIENIPGEWAARRSKDEASCPHWTDDGVCLWDQKGEEE